MNELGENHIPFVMVFTKADKISKLERKKNVDKYKETMITYWESLPEIFISKERWGVDAIYIPEIKLDLDREIIRLKELMDQKDCVNIFLCEGAGVDNIVFELESQGKEILRDAFGHVRLDEINPGKWFAKQFSKKIISDKVLIQKSGYFSRSSKPNEKDLELIFQSADMAVDCALEEMSGVIGLDEEKNNQLQCIEFERIRGGKLFNTDIDWFQSMLKDIRQI